MGPSNTIRRRYYVRWEFQPWKYENTPEDLVPICTTKSRSTNSWLRLWHFYSGRFADLGAREKGSEHHEWLIRASMACQDKWGNDHIGCCRSTPYRVTLGHCLHFAPETCNWIAATNDTFSTTRTHTWGSCETLVRIIHILRPVDSDSCSIVFRTKVELRKWYVVRNRRASSQRTDLEWFHSVDLRVL